MAPKASAQPSDPDRRRLMTHRSDGRVQLNLSSRFENIELAERCLLDLLEDTGLRDSDTEYWLLTALRESLANAIRHGNQQNPELRVQVEYTLVDDCLTMQVVDQGSGFDLDAIPDPTAPENLLRPSGRGIFYMNQFMDEVDFQTGPDRGTTVTMKRTIVREQPKEQHP
jgi:serine/threonine-protein kinase RsbW